MAVTEEHLTIQSILIALELSIFQKKLENSLEIKILQRIFIKYKHAFDNVRMNTFVLDLLILCQMLKVCYIIQICFILMIMREIMK